MTNTERHWILKTNIYWQILRDTKKQDGKIEGK